MVLSFGVEDSGFRFRFWGLGSTDYVQCLGLRVQSSGVGITGVSHSYEMEVHIK